MKFLTSPNTILFEPFTKQMCFKSTGSEEKIGILSIKCQQKKVHLYFFLSPQLASCRPSSASNKRHPSFKQSVSCQTHGCLQLCSCQAALFGCPPNLHPRHSCGTHTEVTIPLTPLGYCVTTCRATLSITLTVFCLTGGRKVARKTANGCSGLPAWHEATISGDERPGGLPLGWDRVDKTERWD